MNFAQHFNRFKKFQQYCQENNKTVYLEFTNRIGKYGPSGLPTESVVRYFAGRPLGTAVADQEFTRTAILEEYNKENGERILMLSWNGMSWQSEGIAVLKEAAMWLTGTAAVKKAA